MKSLSSYTSGILIAIIGVVLFSAKAVMVKMAYVYEVETLHLLVFRMLFALPFYCAILVYTSRKKKLQPTPKEFVWLFFFGFIGYYLAAYFDFLGLQYIKAGLERIILFVYPTLVVIISRLVFKTKINSKQITAILITYLGVVIAFWGEFNMEGANVLLGAFLIFMSALTYASYLVGSGWLIPKFGVLMFTSYAMIISTICVFIHYGIADRGNLFQYDSEVYILGLLMALISTLIPSFLVSLAIKKLGASNFSIVGSFGPISTIILAFIFLDERLTIVQILGSIVVILGVVYISRNKPKPV